MNYEYLVASLPMLFFGDPPPFSSKAFRFRCAGVLSAADGAILEAVMDGRPAAGKAAAAQWTARETQLRNAVVRARAAKWGVDPRPQLRDHAGYDGSVAQAVVDAYAKPTPLEREQALDRCRWRVADEIALREPFGFGAVLAFAVKLLIAERWAGLKDEAGVQAVEDFISEKTGPGRTPAG
jgi:hypothetical protein